MHCQHLSKEKMSNQSVIVSCSACPDFTGALSYALSKLGTPNLVLKEEQKKAILAVYDGNDVFVWLPTGFGKSICFQTLPFMFDFKLDRVSTQKKSLVIVVVPLVALMVDQVQSLRASGVSAVTASSGVREGKVDESSLASASNLESASLVFCSPEALIQDKWRDLLEKPALAERICAVVVDEAHCVSKWYIHTAS